MSKPSYFRAFAMYFNIGNAQTTRKKAALTSKWFKIQCLSPKHQDKSMDSSNLPKEDSYITNTGKTGKSLMKCFSCNNTVDWKEYNDALKKANFSKSKENLEKVYDLIENRSNINNPIEFVLKLLNKYKVKEEYIENFYNNKEIILNISGEDIKLKPNEIMGITETDFKDIIETIKNDKLSIGQKIYETMYLFENESPIKKIKRILDTSKKYLSQEEILFLETLIKNNKIESKDYSKIKTIEINISNALKKEWLEKDKKKTEISQYIVSFYKENGELSEYFLNRNIDKEVLKESDVYEINTQKMAELKRNLLKKYSKELLIETGIMNIIDGKEKFVFETHPVIVPLKTGSYLRGIQYRCKAKTDALSPGGTRFKTLGTKNSNFWENDVKTYTKVIIQEGYSDAMTMASILKKIGITNVKIIGVANATNPYNKTLNAKLQGKEIYKLLDNDSAGKSATKKLFNEMLNGLNEGKYKFKDISSILGKYKDLNEYFISENIETIEKDLMKILNNNDEKEIEIIKERKEEDKKKIIDDNTIIDIENLDKELYKETSSGKYIKLNKSQQIELLFDNGLSIENKGYTEDDIQFSNNFIYDEELYNGHKLIETNINKNFTFEEFKILLNKNYKILRMYNDINETEFELLKKEYLIIKEIHSKTSIENLDIFQYFTNMQQPIEYMLKNKIPFTLRGSAGASVILSRQIRMNKNTNAFDPVKHKDFIDFERFLNIDRKDSLPDIDIDVSSEYREEIRKECNYYIPKTKSGSRHLSRSYPISVKLRGKELETKDLPISDRYLEKFFPSFDILAMSMENIEEILDFTNLDTIDKESFFHYADKYLHVSTNEDELAGKIYHLIKDELKTSNDFISLAALNKTPFNANNFKFTKQYVERLKNREKNNTNLIFLKNTNGFIIYQEQLLEYLTLLGISGEKKQKIRKLNAKPHQLTEEAKKEIEDLFNEVKEAAYNYSGENKEEIKTIFEEQYINLKYNAYIFNFPHAVAYHNINMNLYFNEMDNLIKKLQTLNIELDIFQEKRNDFLNSSKEKQKQILENFQKKYKQLNTFEIEGLIRLSIEDYNKLNNLKKEQKNKKFPEKLPIESNTEEETLVDKKIEENSKDIPEETRNKFKENQKEEEFYIFKKSKTKKGQNYYILNKDLNTFLKEEKAFVENHKEKIRFYYDTNIFTVWDFKTKHQIEKRFELYKERLKEEIIKKQKDGNIIFNKKYNSLIYKLIKENKIKNIEWDKSLKVWVSNDEEELTKIIKIIKEDISKLDKYKSETSKIIDKKKSIKEPIDEEIYEKPIDEEIYEEPIDEEIYEEPINEEIYEEPIDEELIDEEIYEEPIDEEIYEEPINEEIYEEPIDEEIYEEPINEEIYEETTITEEFIIFDKNNISEDLINILLEINDENLLKISKEKISIKKPEKIKLIDDKEYVTILITKIKNDINMKKINIKDCESFNTYDLNDTITNFLKNLIQENNKTIFFDKSKVFIQNKGSIEKEDAEWNEKLIERIRKAINIEKKQYEDEKITDEPDEVYKSEEENKIKIEMTKKWVRISGEIEEGIIDWIQTKLIDEKKYEYIKIDSNKNILIQIADFNEIGKENLDYNFKILNRIKEKMNYKEPKNNKIIIKEDNEYIKIKGELSEDDKILLSSMKGNNIEYHENQDFWSLEINKENLTEKKIEENKKIVENFKKIYSYDYIDDRNPKTNKMKQPN
jgi:hypothetical protein